MLEDVADAGALSFTALLVLAALLSEVDDRGHTDLRVTTRDLAQAIGVGSTTAISAALLELHELGVILHMPSTRYTRVTVKISDEPRTADTPLPRAADGFRVDYGALLVHDALHRGVVTTQAQIAAHFGLSRDVARAYRQRAEELGAVTVTGRGRGTQIQAEDVDLIAFVRPATAEELATEERHQRERQKHAEAQEEQAEIFIDDRQAKLQANRRHHCSDCGRATFGHLDSHRCRARRPKPTRAPVRPQPACAWNAPSPAARPTPTPVSSDAPPWRTPERLRQRYEDAQLDFERILLGAEP